MPAAPLLFWELPYSSRLHNLGRKKKREMSYRIGRFWSETSDLCSRIIPKKKILALHTSRSYA
jgi:hypothetical protein